MGKFIDVGTYGFQRVFDPKNYSKEYMAKEIKNNLRGILEPLGLQRSARDYHITDDGYMILH